MQLKFSEHAFSAVLQTCYTFSDYMMCILCIAAENTEHKHLRLKLKIFLALFRFTAFGFSVLGPS